MLWDLEGSRMRFYEKERDWEEEKQRKREI